MALANLGKLGGGMTIAGTDFPQIFAGHAIEAVNALAMVACGDEQFVKWSPIVSPVKIEADALPQFVFINFAAPPFVENVLVAGENGFDAQHQGTVSSQCALLDQ